MSDSGDGIRLGVIGAGRIAQVAHLPAATKAAGVTLVALSDPSEQLAAKVAARFGIDAYSDTADLLALDLDAVVIAAPDRYHLPLGLQALDAGRHVLMEKPLATSADEAQRLVDVAQARGLRLQTGCMKRHDPGLEFAKANVARIGRILSLQTWYRVMAASRPGIQRTLLPLLVVDETVRRIEDEAKADAQCYRLLTHGAHLFDGLRYLAGDLEWLSARHATVAGDDTWHGSAGIADGGGLASFEITASVHGAWSEGTDLYGERGHIRTRSPYVFSKLGSRVEVYVEDERVATVPSFDDTDPFMRQLESFARAIIGGHETDPTPQDGVEALRVLEAAAASAADDGATVWLQPS
jgi:predicted dehydrogenase